MTSGTHQVEGAESSCDVTLTDGGTLNIAIGGNTFHFDLVPAEQGADPATRIQAALAHLEHVHLELQTAADTGKDHPVQAVFTRSWHG